MELFLFITIFNDGTVPLFYTKINDGTIPFVCSLNKNVTEELWIKFYT